MSKWLVALRFVFVRYSEFVIVLYFNWTDNIIMRISLVVFAFSVDMRRYTSTFATGPKQGNAKSHL